MTRPEYLKKVLPEVKSSKLTYLSLIILICLVILLPTKYLLDKVPSFYFESPQRIEDVPPISFGKTTETFQLGNSPFTMIKWLKGPAMSFNSGRTILAIYDENGRLYDEAVLCESFVDVEPELLGKDTIKIIQRLDDLRDNSAIDYYSNSELFFSRSKFQLSVVFTTYKEGVVELLLENENYPGICRDDLVYKGSGSNRDSSYTLFEVGTDQIKIVRTDDLTTIWIKDRIWKTISVN